MSYKDTRDLHYSSKPWKVKFNNTHKCSIVKHGIWVLAHGTHVDTGLRSLYSLTVEFNDTYNVVGLFLEEVWNDWSSD